MQDEYSDILGSGALNVKPKPTFPFGVKAALASFSLFALYTISVNIWRKFLKWRERSYRLVMRRKHGIPDDDHRPFNVAYAAVQRTRRERETLRSAKSKPMNNVPREQPRPSAQHNQDLRQRTGIGRNVQTAWMNDHNRALPGGYQPTPQNTTGPSRYNQNIDGQPTAYLNEEKVIYPRATELVTSTNYAVPGPIRVSKSQKGDAKKRNYVHMDVDQDSNIAEIVQNIEGEQRQQACSTFKRGAKREFGEADETEDVIESKRAREKRARKVSLEKELPYEEMEVDENELEDGNDLGYISRGKKRDRAEAGSTFGGDDEDQSDVGEIQEENVTRQRSRKRRSVVKKKSDLTIAIRGKKRDRDIDDEPSDDGSDQGSSQTSSRKRRNKRAGRFGDFADDDILMDDSQTKGGSRKIGEEWTSNGVLYKIGPNGQRLRQALVKRARQKYSMPEDSQHPDRDANLEVYVETWLTEDEYQDAKARHLLAWQDSPKASVERGSHVEASQPPSPTGKSLLWKSTSRSSPEGGSPTSEVLLRPILKVKGKARSIHDSRRHSVAVDVVTGVNPFEQNSSQANRRIASGGLRLPTVSGASAPGLVDSTNSSPLSAHRIYSKWEKQDLEANAMMKMRETTRKKEAEERERQEKERQEKERIERERVEKDKATAPPIVPSITVTKPPEDEPTQAENKVPDFFAKPAEPVKEASKPPTTTSFSFNKPEEKTTAQTTPSFPVAVPSATPFFAKSSSNPFMTQAKPAGDSAKAHEQPKPSPFTMPQSLESAATSGPATTASSTSVFSFPMPATSQVQKKPEQNSHTSHSRLGDVAGGNDTIATPAPTTPSIFTFPKPSEAPKPFFSAPSPTTQGPATQVQPVPPTTGSTAPLKFDFKFQNTKPSTVPSGAQSSSAAPTTMKPTNTSFSFKPPTATAPPSDSPFSFKGLTATPSDSGVAAGSSATTSTPIATGFLGATSSAFSGNGASWAPKDGESSKATFIFSNTNPMGVNITPLTGFGNSNTTTSNTGALGGDNKIAFTSFGNVQTPSFTVPITASEVSSKPPVLGTGSSTGTGAFGLGGTNPLGAKAEAPKPVFAYGQNSVPGTASTSAIPRTASTDASKSTFGLGNNDASKGATSATVTPKFAFGVTNSLNKAGAAECAEVAISNAPNPFASNITASSGTGGLKFGSTTASSVFGSGQSAFGSPSNQLALGATGSGQSTLGPPPTPLAPGPTNAPFGSTAPMSSTFGGAPSGQSAFGNASFTKSNLMFGSTASSPSTNNQPMFGNALSEKPNSAFGVPGTPSAFSNATSGVSSSTNAFTFGQPTSNNPNSGSSGQS